MDHRDAVHAVSKYAGACDSQLGGVSVESTASKVWRASEHYRGCQPRIEL